MWTFPNLKPGVLMKKKWRGDRLLTKQLRGNPMHPTNQDHQGSPKAERTELSHNLHMSPAQVHHMEAVFSIVRKTYERGLDDPMDDLDLNMSIWGIFLNTTLQAAVHLGQGYEANLQLVNSGVNTQFQRPYVDVDKLIVQPTLSNPPAPKPTSSPTLVLCVVKMGDDPIATWKSKIQW